MRFSIFLLVFFGTQLGCKTTDSMGLSDSPFDSPVSVILKSHRVTMIIDKRSNADLVYPSSISKIREFSKQFAKDSKSYKEIAVAGTSLKGLTDEERLLLKGKGSANLVFIASTFIQGDWFEVVRTALSEAVNPPIVVFIPLLSYKDLRKTSLASLDSIWIKSWTGTLANKNFRAEDRDEPWEEKAIRPEDYKIPILAVGSIDDEEIVSLFKNIILGVSHSSSLTGVLVSRDSNNLMMQKKEADCDIDLIRRMDFPVARALSSITGYPFTIRAIRPYFEALTSNTYKTDPIGLEILLGQFMYSGCIKRVYPEKPTSEKFFLFELDTEKFKNKIALSNPSEFQTIQLSVFKSTLKEASPEGFWGTKLAAIKDMKRLLAFAKPYFAQNLKPSDDPYFSRLTEIFKTTDKNFSQY